MPSDTAAPNSAPATHRKPPRPAGLGAKAARLWRGVVDVYDLRPDEARILEDACREVDLIEQMTEELVGEAKVGGFQVTGSMGQPVAHPLVGEIRQHRATLARLLGTLDLPDDVGGAGEGSGAPGTGSRSSAGRALAAARWRG